jgi:hypothetical protein
VLDQYVFDLCVFCIHLPSVVILTVYDLRW